MIVRRTSQPDLSRPRGGFTLGIHYDPDAFGRFSETLARFLGTGRFLAFQTVLVVTWISYNLLGAYFGWSIWDEYPFILLNLAFSTQAAYAAPLILLAQNRQDERDRAQAEVDRDLSNRTQADTEYLARELAAVRVALSDVVTNQDLLDAVGRVTSALEAVTERLDHLQPAARAADGGTAPDAGPGG